MLRPSPNHRTLLRLSNDDQKNDADLRTVECRTSNTALRPPCIDRACDSPVRHDTTDTCRLSHSRVTENRRELTPYSTWSKIYKCR